MTEPMQIRDEIDESYSGDELPAQQGLQTPTILPGVDHFRLPVNIDRCWDAKDYEKRNAEGLVQFDNNGMPLTEQHFLLKFDADNPMIVQGGDYDGLPATATITTIPRRRRGKGPGKDNGPLVHDITYLVRECLNDKTPVTKKSDWMAIINRYPGAVIRLEHGLSAQCSPDRVRYVDAGDGTVVQDPDGTMGCGDAAGRYRSKGGRAEGDPETRLYTQSFKTTVFVDQRTGTSYPTRDEALQAVVDSGGTASDVRATPAWTDHAVCKGCGAVLRGFFRIEKFLKPLASPIVSGG